MDAARRPVASTESNRQQDIVADGPASGQPRNGRSPWMDVALMCVLVAVVVWLCLGANGRSEFWWNDAPRHAMDGVFVFDFVRDLPQSLSLVQYATEYYARYPCLALVQYPPVFAVAEGLFFAVFGVHAVVARLTVAAFAALGVVAGYALARRFLGRLASAVFVLLTFAAPDVVYWSREVMLETPMLAMMLLASYVFVRFTETGRTTHGVFAGILLTLAVLTKQTACVLVPVWVGYAVWQRGWHVLRQRGALAAAALVGVTVVLYAAATLRYSPVITGEVVGSMAGDMANPRLSWQAALFYPLCLSSQVGWLCLALAAAGAAHALVSAVARRCDGACRAAVLGALWALTCYLTLTFVIAYKEWRYILVWVPGLALVAAAGVDWISRWGRAGRFLTATVLAVSLLQAGWLGVGDVCGRELIGVPRVSGVAPVAEYLADSPRGTVVFYGGWLNGNFVFHMRECDSAGNVIVLRSTKMLVATMAQKRHGMEVLVEAQDGILDMFHNYGVRYVVLEAPCPRLLAMAPVFHELHKLVRTDKFVLRKTFPLEATVARSSPEIAVYEFREAGPARAKSLEIRVPAAGRVISVPMHRLGIPTTEDPPPPDTGAAPPE